MSKRDATKPASDTAAVQAALAIEPAPEPDWRSLPFVEPLAVTVGYKLAGLLDPAQGAPLTKRVKGVRQGLSESMGVLLPPVVVRDNLSLKPSQYAVLLNGTVIAQAEVFPDKLMALASGEVYGQLDGIPGVEPAYGMPVVWITAETRANALGLGYQVIDPATVIATHVSKLMRDHMAELLRHEDVPALLERLAAVAPKLAAAVEKALTHSQLLKVFRLLVAENVSLKDIVPIATTLLEASETTKDPILLAAEVRCAVRRQIVASLVGQSSEMKVFNLSSELENMLLGSLNQASAAGKIALDNYPVDPNLLSQLQVNMPMVREQMKRQGATPLLLVMPQIRPLLSRYARLFAPGLAVLSYNEIPEQRDVSIIGSLG